MSEKVKSYFTRLETNKTTPGWYPPNQEMKDILNKYMFVIWGLADFPWPGCTTEISLERALLKYDHWKNKIAETEVEVEYTIYDWSKRRFEFHFAHSKDKYYWIAYLDSEGEISSTILKFYT